MWYYNSRAKTEAKTTSKNLKKFKKGVDKCFRLRYNIKSVSEKILRKHHKIFFAKHKGP